MTLTDRELERYSRQLVLPEWSGEAQERLRAASAIVVGAGALGSPAAMYLTAAGIGRIGVVDSDAVELSNLHRQLLHFTPDVEVAKAENAAVKLRALNPEVEVDPYPARLEEANAEAILIGAELPRGRCARPGGRDRRLDPGTRGDQAPHGCRAPAARPHPPGRRRHDGADADRDRAARGLPRLFPGSRYGTIGLSMFGVGTLTRVARELRKDLTAAQERDPAARGIGRAEILLTYGGVQALLLHRVAHAINDTGVPFVPHAVANFSRMMTGIEIHPAAEIGDNVTLYQGVTLGWTGFARGKRHPTVEDEVVVGSGAKLLGPITVGRGSKVGANSVVIHDVPANSTVVGNPGHPVRVEGKKPGGPDADWAHLPDPVADAIRALSRRVTELEKLLAEATGRKPEPTAEVRPLRNVRGSDPAAG